MHALADRADVAALTEGEATGRELVVLLWIVVAHAAPEEHPVVSHLALRGWVPGGLAEAILQF